MDELQFFSGLSIDNPLFMDKMQSNKKLTVDLQ